MSATPGNWTETPAQTRIVPFVIGAYPMLPPGDEDRSGAAALYAAPGDLGQIDGIELPFRKALDAPELWLAEQLAGCLDQCVITVIPGTMGRAGTNPVFGLVSSNDSGHAQALAYTRSLLKAVDRLHEVAGEQLVTRVELRLAPHHQATPEAFHASLSGLSEDFASHGLGVIVGHCGAEDGVGPSERAFLTLAQKIVVCWDTAALIAVNWGRSVIETYDLFTPEGHVYKLVEAGLLDGIIISGAEPEGTQWTWAWADVYLPLAEHEPTSWLTSERMTATIRAANDAQVYRDLKINIPVSASLEGKPAWVRRIREAMLSA